MAERVTQQVRTALFYGFMVLIAWLLFLVLEPFLTPLLWAAVLAIVFYPLHERINKRAGPTPSAGITTLVVTAILIVPVILLMTTFVEQAVEALRSAEPSHLAAQSGWFHRAWTWLAGHVPGAKRLDLAAFAQQAARQATTYLAGQLGGVVTHIAIFVFDLVITIFAMFYFFRDAAAIMRWLRRLLPFSPVQRERMIKDAHDLVFVTVASNLAAAGLAGLIGGLAFLAVGIHRVIFWGVVMAFCGLLPVVGSWMIWVPAAAVLLAEGHPARAIVLLAICAAAMLVIDYVLRPVMMGRTRINGLLVLIGVFGGIAVFGMIGVVLGPVVIATAVGLLKTYTRPAPATGPPETPTTAVLE